MVDHCGQVAPTDAHTMNPRWQWIKSTELCWSFGSVVLIILAHGINHAQCRRRTTAWFESIGFRNPELQWLASTATEIAVGVLLVIGLLIGPAAAGLAAVMLVAFWAVHRNNGFFIFRPGEGWEYVATLAMNGTVPALAGPGTASREHALRTDVRLSSGVGVLLVAGAAVAAAA
jgi:putative oxidoreductase